MQCHDFLFSPGIWLGTGSVKMTSVKEQMRFSLKWSVTPFADRKQTSSSQQIEIHGLSDIMNNEFLFYDIGKKDFKIKLENLTLGEVIGEGFFNPGKIGWEFRLPEVGFEGFEVYEKQNDESYFFHAEYASDDDFRTMIQGKIWKKED